MTTPIFYFFGATQARADFKNVVGQANHFLVTLELGLECLSAFGKPPNSYFAPMWNPKEPTRSISRSEDYLLGAAMAWAVDCLDGYIGQLARTRGLIHPKLRAGIIRNNKSIQKATDEITTHYHLEDDYRSAMVHLLIQWRNNLTHVRAKNSLRSEMRKLLIKNAACIHKNHRGLDLGVMLGKFDQNLYPEFKEVAGMLKATHDFVETVDACVAANINLRRYVSVRLKNFFSSSTRIQKLGNAFDAKVERKKNYVGQILREFGVENAVVKPDVPSSAVMTFEEIAGRFPNFKDAKTTLGRI